MRTPRPGWASTVLDQVARWGSGGTPSRSNPQYYGGGIPWVKTGELGPRLILSTEETLSELGLRESSAKLFPKGAVALAMYGATIGKASVLGIDSTTNQACAVAIPDHELTTSDYLYYYLCSQREAFVEAGKGGAQPNISQGVIKDWPVPLAPLPEQKRIADKLDALLARVHACHERLDRVPAILKHLRQAVLAAATSGELTREWREERHAPDSRRSIAFDDDTLDVPESWNEAALRELLDPTRPLCYGVVQPGQEFPLGPLLVRVQDLSRGTVVLDDLRTISDAIDREYQRSRVRAGDVLISVVGTIGRIAVVPQGFAGNIARAIARLACGPSVLPEWIRYWLENSVVQSWLVRNSREVARKTLNLSELATTRVAVPSLQEQAEIVRRTGELLAFVISLEHRVKTAQRLVGSTTSSALSKAFRGELVPQDPSDEPASELLARIRKSRELVPAERPRLTRSRRTKPGKEFAAVMKKLIDVLAEVGGWVTAQEAFRSCGIVDGSKTEPIEGVYAELRELERSKRVVVEPVRDAQGRKLHDRLKFIAKS